MLWFWKYGLVKSTDILRKVLEDTVKSTGLKLSVYQLDETFYSDWDSS